MQKVVVTCALIGALLADPAHADAPRNGSIQIKVEDAGWGDIDTRDIEDVLHAAANLLLPPAKRTSAFSIHVSHSESCPSVLYDRGPAGEYQVLLHANKERWHLYAYEFAHELCHIASNFDRAGPEIERRNQWFEEAVCEAASLYVLTRLEQHWRSDSAHPRHNERAGNVRVFLDEMEAGDHERFGEIRPIDTWLGERMHSLRADPYQRVENERIARAMLPLFDTEPVAWEAIAYMNLHPGDPLASIEEFLRHWHAAAPQEMQKAFIAGLSRIIVGEGGIRDHPATAAAESQ